MASKPHAKIETYRVSLLVAGLGFLALALTLILAGTLNSPVFLILTFLSVVSLGPFIARRGRINFLEPLYWVCGTFFLHICIRGWLIASGWRSLQLSSPYLTYSQAMELLLPSLLLSGAGLLSFFWGYFNAPARTLGVHLGKKILLNIPINRKAIWALLGLWVVGWFFRWLSVAYGGSIWLNVIRSAEIEFNYAAVGPLDLLASLHRVAWVGILSLYFLKKKRAPLRVLITLMLGVELGYGFLSGYKQFILEPILGIVVAYYIATRKSNFLKWLPALLAVVLLSGTVVQAYRVQALLLGPEAGMTEVIAGMGNTPGDAWENVVDSLGNRLVLDNLLLALAYVPNPIPFAYGATFLPKILLSFIPQALWPERNVAWSRDFFAELHGPYVGGTAPTLFGDLYFNFGIPGVILGMFAVGFLMRLIYEGLCSSQTRGLGNMILFGSLLLRWFDISGMGLINLLFPLVRDLPLGLLAMWLVGRLSRQDAGYSQRTAASPSAFQRIR